MPHEQKLRKNLWEVRDCDVKLKKLQAALEAAKLATIAAQKEEDDAGEAIASVVKQREEALENQQKLLLLCKNGGPPPPEPTVQREWVEGMAGLQAFMAVCQAMEASLSDEDKALLGTMQIIQNRMAQRTAVSDDDEGGDADESMEQDSGAAKLARPDDDEGKQPKKQCTPANGLDGRSPFLPTSATLLPPPALHTPLPSPQIHVASLSRLPPHTHSQSHSPERHSTP